MDDLISRADAIDALQEEINKGTPPFDDTIGAIRCGVRLARNIIEDLPSAQPKILDAYTRGWTDGADAVKAMPQRKLGEWIPCEERLPKNDDWKVITVRDETADIPYIYTDFGWYFERANCWIVDAEQRTDVIAWMPLPLPYCGARMTERSE